MQKIEVNICIIGAGPAGTTTSIFLSKMGIKHLIIDAAVFPREKVCGDGLDMKTIRMLNHIDPSIIPNELLKDKNYTPSWGMRSITPSGKIKDYTYRPLAGEESKCPFIVAKRFNFDNFLVGKIDTSTADFRQDTRVKTIAKEGKDWKLTAYNADGELEITCQLIVGADGDHSTVLKYLGDRKVNRNHYWGSVRQYWKNVEGSHKNNLLEFYYPKDLPMGYFWIFPLANGEFNVGYGITSQIASERNLNIRKIFREIIANDPVIAHRFKNAEPVGEEEGWGIPVASLRRKVVGDGWLLVGDAASMVSPNTGEGIGTGMMTGYIAAKFIQKGLATGNFDEKTLANYSREVYKRMESQIKSYNFYLKYPGFNNFLMNNFVGDGFLFQLGFKYMMRGWLKTAYEKEVKVDLD